MVLPIRGYGLWSTLWGFVAIDAQSLKKGPGYVTITGLKYYEQKETPGLGGEVDNPNWRAKWPGKHVYDSNWNVQIEVTKGGSHGEYEVDALSGATITSNGVTNMMQFWFGEDGFRPFLKNYSPTVGSAVRTVRATIIRPTQLPPKGGRYGKIQSARSSYSTPSSRTIPLPCRCWGFARRSPSPRS